MDDKEFNKLRDKIAQHLGVSLKAFYSYEQNWQNIPAHLERQLLFLLSGILENSKDREPCWVIKKCPTATKKQCPAWEFQAGQLCWFIYGTICCGHKYKDWKEKMEFCRSCEVLKSFL